MKRYFAVVSMMCLFALACIAGAAAQEAQKANPATDFEYDLTKDGEGLIIKKYTGKVTDVIIPAVIEDISVVAVASKVFKETNIVSIVFPDSVRGIGYSCFAECTSLQNVVLPKNLKALSQYLFYNCTALKEIILPNGIEIIYEGAFYHTGLKSITLPDSVQVIENSDPRNGVGAFADCENLQTVNIGNGTKVIGARTFEDCANLTTVTIGSGIRSIRSYAFHNCSSLTTMNIGVWKLENDYDWNVFSGCSSLSLKEKQKIRKTGYTGEF